MSGSGATGVVDDVDDDDNSSVVAFVEFDIVPFNLLNVPHHIYTAMINSDQISRSFLTYHA